MAEGEPSSRGLFSSLAGMFDTLLAAVQNRVELFAVELQEEKCRFIEVLLWAASAIFLAAMAVTVLTFAIIYLSGLLFGEAARLWFLIGFALLYAGGAYGAVCALRRRLKGPQGPFAGTIAELKKDRECLRPRK